MSRPRIGDKPLTPAERSARARARRRAERQAQASMPSNDGEQNAQEALAALISSRRIVNRFDQMLAVRVINALAEGKIVEVIKLLDALPQPYRAEQVAAAAVTPSDAKAKLLELVENAIAADEFEQQQQEEREVHRLREEVARLKAKCGEPEVDLVNCSAPEQSKPEPKVIDPPTSAILPPSENSHLPQNMRREDSKYDKPKPPVVIDAKPVKKAADPGPPAGYDPCVSGLWRPPASTAKPVETPPSSPPSKNWAARPSEAAWNAWRASGGCTGSSAYEPVGDGTPVLGWLAKLNGTEW
jgi:hypothetical protein